jgi:hypothetical protein
MNFQPGGRNCIAGAPNPIVGRARGLFDPLHLHLNAKAQRLAPVAVHDGARKGVVRTLVHGFRRADLYEGPGFSLAIDISP